MCFECYAVHLCELMKASDSRIKKCFKKRKVKSHHAVQLHIKADEHVQSRKQI